MLALRTLFHSTALSRRSRKLQFPAPYRTMSWTCSSSSNSGLIENLYRENLIKTERVKDAFKKVDRAHYSKIMPYEDSPQVIGYDATISAPHIHAVSVEELKDHLKPGSKVLDIGCGSGYLTAVLAHLVGSDGQVTGIDHISQLTDMSQENLKKSPDTAAMLEKGTIRIVTGDGRKGYAANSPYDAIHVGAAASSIHDELVEQLNSPGRMFLPVEETSGQYMWRVMKDKDGRVTKERLFGVMFVPLTDRTRR